MCTATTLEVCFWCGVLIFFGLVDNSIQPHKEIPKYRTLGASSGIASSIQNPLLGLYIKYVAFYQCSVAGMSSICPASTL